MRIKSIALALLSAILLAPVAAASGPVTSALLFKSPECACCDGHAAALRKAGYTVRVVPTAKMADVKARAGVPADLLGCHTTIIGGYAVEGHVPIASVRKLLAEKPAVRGIALPGMPAGSPGMGGSKTAPFKVMSFGANGTQVFSVE